MREELESIRSSTLLTGCSTAVTKHDCSAVIAFVDHTVYPRGKNRTFLHWSQNPTLTLKRIAVETKISHFSEVCQLAGYRSCSVRRTEHTEPCSRTNISKLSGDSPLVWIFERESTFRVNEVTYPDPVG